MDKFAVGYRDLGQTILDPAVVNPSSLTIVMMTLLNQHLKTFQFLSLLCLGGLFISLPQQPLQAATFGLASELNTGSDFRVTEEINLAQTLPAAASANGKYQTLLQTLNCPEDGDAYGNYHDYGYWGGGSWCGQTGRAGYWVWSAPNWYVWEAVTPVNADAGKYSGLVQVLNCPEDASTYGDFRDYGYWGGGSWCGQTGAAGYWVWSYPNWYVWQNTQ